MSVQIGAAPKASKKMPFKRGNLSADGTEQVLAEFEGQGKVSGNVDLHEMGDGDKIVVRQYMKALSTSEYEKYAEETYQDAQDLPLLYFPEKVTDTAIKITLEQTQGISRRYQHTFIVED